MSRVLVGNVTSDGDRLIHKYLEKFMPDAVIEPLKASGIRSKLKMHAKRPDVAFIIIDEPLYQQCVGTIADVLNLPKVHKYVNDSGLKEFLISKFGILEGLEEEPVVVDTPTSEPEVEVVSPVVMESTDTDLDFGGIDITGGITDSTTTDEEVERLKRELSQSQLLVKNLTRQLQNSGDDSDVTALVNRIKELESSLKERDSKISDLENESYISAGKVAKAETAISKLADVEKELKQQRELNAQASFTKSELEKTVSSCKAQIVDLEGYKSKYQTTKEQLEKSQAEYKRVYAQYESKCDEYTVLLTRAENAEKGSTSVHKQVKELNTKIVDLQSQLEAKAKEVSSFETKCREAEQTIKDLKTQLKSVTDALKTSNDSIKSLETKLSDSNARVSTLEKELSDAKEETSLALDENTTLESQLKDARQAVSNLEETNKGVSAELASAKASIESYKIQVENLNSSIKDLKEKSSDLVALQSKLTEKEAEVVTKDAKITSLEGVLSVKESEITDLEARLKNMSASVGNNKELETKVSTLQDDLTRVKNQLASKTEDYTKLMSDKDSIERDYEHAKLDLEAQVADKNREIKNLESEIELLKRGEDKEGKTADLRMQIIDLQEEIQMLKRKRDNSNVEEIIKLKEELSSIKMRSVDLEVELAERDDRMKEIQSSIFTTMSNCALPRLMVDAQVEVPNAQMPKCHVVACGSAESNIYLYKAIKNTCIANQTKKIVIVDISSDSYIDAEFKIKRIHSPINWLMGTEAISNFVSDTYLGNVKVVSSSLSYTNPLYFLSVNWVLRLQELNSLTKHADIVIINVGILNDMVSKILFQSFANIMKSHIVLRATPVNIRTAFLSFAGIKNVDKAEIACMSFDNASKVMYQKLAGKYNKTKILRDTDGLEV